MQRTIKALIFDFDGTVADTMPLHFLAWTETVRRHGLDFPEPRFYALGGVPTHDILRMLSSEQQKNVDIEKMAIEKEEAFLKYIPQVKAISAVEKIVRLNQGKFPMAIASGGITPIVKKVLQQLQMESVFNAIVTSEHVKRQKPNPDIFLEAARQLNVSAEHCRAYEDTDIGLQAIQAAGMDAVDVRGLTHA